MNIFKSIWSWITGGVKHLGDLVAKLWALAEPFLQQVLSETAQSVWSSLQTLAVQAVQYVEAQGLPTDQAKQDAFLAYMASKAKDQIAVLKTSEINLLRETALAIFAKAQSGIAKV
jgi:hypothetical protein